MPFISRTTQIADRVWDPFSPYKRTLPYQDGVMSLAHANIAISDEILDGINLQRRDVPAFWINENDVHRAVSLSDNIDSTKYFLGSQVVATRDDVRQLSHILVIEPGSLSLVTTELGRIVAKQNVHSGGIRRANLTLENYSGDTRVLYCAAANGDYLLFLDGSELQTTSKNVDFPFMAVEQAAKGRISMAPPSYRLLSYKCRSTGQLYLRDILDDGSVGEERVLPAPATVGGVDFAIHNDSILFHIDAVVDGNLVPMVAESSDRGVTISEFKPVDLQGFQPETVLPASAPIARDYQGNFHIPIAALKDGNQHLLDVHDDHAVEAMVLKGQGTGYNLLVFPKKSDSIDAKGIGDGNTDGVGIIATTIIDGKLMITNSQCGGYKYPKERCVNFEMPQMFAFRATECCYTRAQSANMVSMDYVFIEANHDGDPLSPTLWLETWDMPLPLPKITATAVGNVVNVAIVKDAWFDEGKTTFKISDPKITIRSAKLVDDRNAVVECNSDDLKGKTIFFEMKNFFYWHAGETEIA